MEFLEVQNLCKTYGKGDNQVTALDHVSLTIAKGEFTAIIGSSGSGKSTLLHIIAGVDIPTSGTVFLNGQDVYAQNRQQLAIFRRRQVGMIYQFHKPHPHPERGGEHHPADPDGPAPGSTGNVWRTCCACSACRTARSHLPNQLSGGSSSASPSGAP